MILVLKVFFAFYVISFAGHVGCSHIKRGRTHHRNQCRPRLTPSEELGSSRPSIPTLNGGSSTTPTLTLLYPSSTFESFSTPLFRQMYPTITSLKLLPSMVTTAQNVVSTSSADEMTKSQESNALQSSLIPNNIKAGIAGGDAYPFMEAHIGWWYDWSPDPFKPGSPIPVAMLWGNGTADAQDAERLSAFEHLSNIPRYVLGFEEPDCPSGSGSAGMSVSDGVSKWEALIAPLKAHGTVLGSPSMCKQADETWLAQFEAELSTPWDFTAIHINKNSMVGVKKDIEHYMKYDKPIWVTEFACVDDLDQFTPCTDQKEINAFINEIVPYFESNPNVFAYAYSNGEGLGDLWPLMNGNSLSESGQTYLHAISKYH